jgi:Glycosyltransferases involved in cell wall biogenesis
MNKNSEVLIIIPALNEAGRIERVINSVKNYTKDADILVIDDGSVDDTVKVATESGAKVISLPFNVGVGAALQTGYKYAALHSYNYLVQLDADGQHRPEYLPQFIDILINKEADLLIGSRFINYTKKNTPLSRRLGILLFAKITSLLIRHELTDPTSGYRGMKKKVIEFCATENFSFDYPDANFLLTLHRAGFKVREIPVEMEIRSGGVSQHNGLKPVVYMIKMLLSIFVILLRKPPETK